MLQKLDEILAHFGIKTPFVRNLFIGKTKVNEFQKNQTIFLEGKSNEFEYFLLKGVLRRYNISDKGDIVTTGFYMENSIITPHFARTHSSKNIFTLESLTDSIVAEIKVKDLDNLRYTNPEFQLFGQKTVESQLSNMFFSEVVYRSYSAKERLQILRNQYPNLENLVPHHIIASYLGVTNVSFSRLRSDFSN